jgi:photosystem II stability/assembly factor-like uncharacterized protein
MDARLSAKACARVLAFSTLVIAQVPATAAAQSWVNVTGNLANMSSECGNLYRLSGEPGSGRIIAGVALRGLWVNSSDATWTQLGTGAGSDTITNRPTWIAYDPAHPGTFWESGIYNGGGVYNTTDGGSTFRRLGSISHNDYVSVDFSDPARQLLLAGGHEQSRTIYRSTNGGQNWSNIGSTLPEGTKPSTIPHLIDPTTYLVNAAGFGSGTGGIFRTTDGGASWQQVSTFEPSWPPLVTSDGAIYWPGFGGGLVKSSDGGMTWTQVGNGLRGVTPVELPDHRLVSAGQTHLMVSADGGSTWTPLGPALPYGPLSVVYSPVRRAFFISRWDCGGVVLPDAVMRLDFDATPGILPPTNLRVVPPTPGAGAN